MSKEHTKECSCKCGESCHWKKRYDDLVSNLKSLQEKMKNDTPWKA